jgi:hypothetical protein
LGETDVIASGVVTGVVLPPTPEEDPGAPPHPESREAKRQKVTTRRRNLRGPRKLVFIECADYRITGYGAS